MDLKTRLIRRAAKRVESLSLPKRRIFEFIVDLILPIRTFVDWSRIKKLKLLCEIPKNKVEKNSGWAKLEFDKEITHRLTSIAKEVKENYLKSGLGQQNKKEYL